MRMYVRIEQKHARERKKREVNETRDTLLEIDIFGSI